MTVFGNDPGPYHLKGLLQSLDQMRQASAKAAIIAREIGERWMMVKCCRIEGEVMQLIQEAKRKESK